MEKKYEILEDDTIQQNCNLDYEDDCWIYRTFYRIKALKDFGHVKKGELGGYVEHDRNLSQIGECWVADNARVMDDAYVYDNALIMDQAVVMGNAQVSEDVIVRGDYIVARSTVLKGDNIYGLKEDEDDKTDNGKKSDDSEDIQAADRHNDGKLQWSLVDFECLEPLVRALEYGEDKYSSFNWKKGMPQTKIIESLLRHTFAYLGGEDNDSESGVSHIGHIMSNAMFLANSAKNPEWDDRFKGLDNE
jgi:hypothetical protein